jgi:hypothetical protein
MRIAGPKPRSSVAHELPWRIGTALISTSRSIRNFSSPGSTKAGSSVVKVAELLPSLAGQVTGTANLPSMLVPRL